MTVKIESGQVQVMNDTEFWQRAESEPQTVRVEYHPAVDAEVAEAVQR